MDKTIKALVRRELVMDLVKTDMDQEQLENYLKSDMKKLPSEWVKDRRDDASEKDMDEFLDTKYPKK